MAFSSTAKLSELPLKSPFPLTPHSSSLHFLFSHPKKPSFPFLKPFSSQRTTQHSATNNNGYSYPWDDRNPKPSLKPKSPSAPWLNQWPPTSTSTSTSTTTTSSTQLPERRPNEVLDETQNRYFDKDKGRNAFERIILRIRNLGLGSDDEQEEEETQLEGQDEAMPLTGEETLSDLLRREWVRPDFILGQEKNDDLVLPWDRGEEEEDDGKGERGLRKRRAKAPTLAELTLEDEELRRLRRIGMHIRERISVPKAGLTQAVLDKIHSQWRREELVRLKFHEVLARDMKTAHEIVEVRFQC